jgi:DNA-directed RNA polymerase subunit alpha
VIQRNWTELIKPNKLNVEAGADPKREATVLAEPLERGFGLTLGNALRRILLSSLQGAAVTSVSMACCTNFHRSLAFARMSRTSC